MSLAAISLAVLAPALSPTQLPIGELTGPNGGLLQIHDIELSGTEHWVLGRETLPMGGQRPVVARIDSAGAVIWTPPLPAALGPSGSDNARLLAVGENRILVKDLNHVYRTYALTPQAWVAEPALTPVFLASISPVLGDISGSQVTLSAPHLLPNAAPIVVDLASGAGPESLPILPNSGIWQLAVGDGIAAAVEAEYVVQPSGEYVLVAHRIPLFRRINGAWRRVEEIRNPTGFDWRGSIKIALEGGTVAVSAQKVSPTDPCPKLFIFEEDPSGAFVLSAEFEAASSCATSSTMGIGYDSIQLLGLELTAIEGLDGRVDRFERTATGWTRRERVAAQNQLTQAWPVNGRIVGGTQSSSAGSEVLAVLNSPGSTTVGCASSAPSYSILRVENRAQTAVGPTNIVWTIDAAPPATPYFLAVGFQPGSRPLGPAAELCIGGSVSVMPMTTPQPNFGKDVARRLLDPVAEGLQPGETLYVQGWRPEASIPGGLTSNSLAILFAP